MIHIVLFEPEIPQNTGNIMRTCAASGSCLHLIKPYGFYLDEKHLRRSGMDYRDDITLFEHDDWQSFCDQFPSDHYYFITRYGQTTYSDVSYDLIDQDIFLVFGKESTGIDKRILRDNLDHCLRVPMIAKARSLNLANTVALVLYEVLRQRSFAGLSKYEVIKGKDFLKI